MVLFSCSAIIALAFALLVDYWDRESREDSIQREKILEILNNSEVVKQVVSFGRSRENSCRYFLMFVLENGAKIDVSDVYVSKNTLYYGYLFRLGDCTEPVLLIYDGESVHTERRTFQDISDPDIIEIYHHHNLSRLIEQNEKYQKFLASFPFLDEEMQKKLGRNREVFSELVKEFDLSLTKKNGLYGMPTTFSRGGTDYYHGINFFPSVSVPAGRCGKSSFLCGEFLPASGFGIRSFYLRQALALGGMIK